MTSLWPASKNSSRHTHDNRRCEIWCAKERERERGTSGTVSYIILTAMCRFPISVAKIVAVCSSISRVCLMSVVRHAITGVGFRATPLTDTANASLRLSPANCLAQSDELCLVCMLQRPNVVIRAFEAGGTRCQCPPRCCLDCLGKFEVGGTRCQWPPRCCLDCLGNDRDDWFLLRDEAQGH